MTRWIAEFLLNAMPQRERLRDFQKLALISSIAVVSGSALDDARATICSQISCVLQLDRRPAYSTLRPTIEHSFQIDRDLCHMVRDPCQIDRDFCQIDRNSCQVDRDPCQVDTDRCQLDRDPCQIIRDCCQIGRDSNQIDTHLYRIHRDPCQIDRDLSKIDRDLCQIDSVSELKKKPLFMVDKNKLQQLEGVPQM